MLTKFGKTMMVVMLAVAFFTLTGENAKAQDGKALYVARGCQACHGNEGKEPVLPNYPRLAGQNRDYMVAQLQDFKAAKRTNNLAALMMGMSNALTEAEIKALAEYLAGVK